MGSFNVCVVCVLGVCVGGGVGWGEVGVRMCVGWGWGWGGGGPAANTDRRKQPISTVRASGGLPGNVNVVQAWEWISNFIHTI